MCTFVYMYTHIMREGMYTPPSLPPRGGVQYPRAPTSETNDIYIYIYIYIYFCFNAYGWG